VRKLPASSRFHLKGQSGGFELDSRPRSGRGQALRGVRV